MQRRARPAGTSYFCCLTDNKIFLKNICEWLPTAKWVFLFPTETDEVTKNKSTVAIPNKYGTIETTISKLSDRIRFIHSLLKQRHYQPNANFLTCSATFSLGETLLFNFVVSIECFYLNTSSLNSKHSCSLGKKHQFSVMKLKTRIKPTHRSSTYIRVCTLGAHFLTLFNGSHWSAPMGLEVWVLTWYMVIFRS